MNKLGIDDPDIAHDMMMDHAAEVIDNFEYPHEFLEEMEEYGMPNWQASNIWADHVENQNFKWGDQ